jgi:Sel1 repeat
LGACYATGSGGLKTNHVEAVRLYGLSAAQGNPTGKAALGNAYRIGEGGLPQDESRAVLLLQSSAAKGDGLGQADLGFAYRSHLGGLTEDQREAVRLYALSAAQGNALGQANLGSAYRQGLGGLPKSDVMAVALYKLSAAQGHAHGQNNLGVAYEDGIGGLSKNLRKALDLYQSAADQGYSKAGENLSDLRRKLDNMLRAAVESDSCAAITTAVQSGAPVNGLFVNQPTPLIVSILRRKVASAACLLLLKADPNQPHPSGRTPLMAAAATQQRTIMVDLMKHHADAHTVDGWGLTADSYNNANGTKMIMLLDDMAATLMRTRRPPTSNSPYRTMADQQLSLGMGVRRGPDGQLLQSLGKLAIAKFFDTTMTDDTFAPNHLPDLAQISDPDAALMLRRQFDTYAKAAWIELAKDYARQILALVDESTKPKLHARFIAVFAEAGYDYSTLNPL